MGGAFDKLQVETRFCRTVNLLSLNKNKTGTILFGQTGPLASCRRPVSRNLGVIFDSAFDKHISTVVKMRLLGEMEGYPPLPDFERVIHAFIASHLHYCNSLHVGPHQSSLCRPLGVQNAAAAS